MFEAILEDFLQIRLDFLMSIPDLQADKTNSFKSKTSDIDGEHQNSPRGYFDLISSYIRLSKLSDLFNLSFASIRKELIFTKVHLFITEDHKAVSFYGKQVL